MADLILATLFALGMPGALPEAQSDPVDAVLAEFGSADPRSPGCSVAASRNNQTLFNRSFGLASLEHGVPITQHTRFNVASVAKQFTAAAILTLVQDGRLSLNDEVRRYIPELPDYGVRLTIDHLLTHSAGLRDFPFLAELQGWSPEPRRQFTQEEIVALIASQRSLNFTPGESWSYSNSNYVLAAEIVRRVSGQPLRVFLEDRLFRPLGMTDTVMQDDSASFFPNEAGLYYGPQDAQRRAIPISVHGDGNLISSPADLITWSQAIDGGRLGPVVTTELQREARSRSGRPLRYARGLTIGNYRGVTEISHGGGIAGATAYVARYPSQGIAVAVTCNTGKPVDRIARRIADLYLRDTAATGTPTLAPIALANERLTPLAGVFFDEARGIHAVLTVTDGKLHWGRTPAEPLSESRFRLSPSWEIEFETPASISSINLETGITRIFSRIDSRVPTMAETQALAGEYKNDELGSVWSVQASADGITMRIVRGPTLEWTLSALSRDVFGDNRDTVRFIRSADGRGTTFLVSNPRSREIRFDRIRER